ncbi:Inner membrane transport protein YajR [hydrothermal vent metagenome]|uniref:Inner membrane transport protein YajR n=1 Tax=hydrothermal vent metagenome TaxID=652676 RepID=A0A3B0ZD78_9ZZZZ
MTINNDKMSGVEKRTAVSLAGVFSTRMLGLFMILPVFSVLAEKMPDYSATLAGIAIGIYGLTQAALQIPLGLLSDKIGRKPVILGGLFVFALGSVVAATADSLLWIVIGRAMQGLGAVASAVMALAADLTREEHRMKVMATIGMSIGLSFAVALVLGPLVNSWFGLSGIFWLTAVLAVCGMLIVLLWVPTPTVSRFHRDAQVETGWFKSALKDPQLLRLDASILILHSVLMSSFVVMPFILRDRLGLVIEAHWQIYLPILFLSMVGVVPLIIVGEKKRKLKQMLIMAIVVLALAELGFWLLGHSLAGITFMLLFFFLAFNLVEATMPSLVAKMAPAAHKGTAMGAYSSAQFFGVFIGAVIGGWLMQHWGLDSVLLFNVLLLSVWLVLIISMREPQYSSSMLLNVGTLAKSQAAELADTLSQIEGVLDVTVIAEDGVAYIKVDKQNLNEEDLMKYSVNH